MKRTPLRRKTPLRRSAWKRRPAKPPRHPRRRNSYSLRERFVSYMLWCKKQPCIVTTMPSDTVMWFSPLHERHTTKMDCLGEIQADHAGERAMGRKAHDGTCIPICRGHHDQKTNGWGMFWSLTLEQKRAWRKDAIAHTHERARVQNVTIPVEAI